MVLLGKMIGYAKKLGKTSPLNTIKKIGKIGSSVLSTAHSIMDKVESVGNKIADVPIIGDLVKGVYKAPIFKGVSPEMIFQGAKTGLAVADKVEKTAKSVMGGGGFSVNSAVNIGNKHLSGQRGNAGMINDIISSASSHPAVRSRVRGLTKHLQAQTIMKATPLSQVSNIVKHHNVRQVNSSMG